ncbi:MAG: rod shape-determining protein RodA [Treponema sp.]|nr:rod shape-determining protein RodA [Treponema sp.]
MKIKILEAFDYVLFACVMILITCGILFIYSAAINSEGLLVSNEYIKQIIWASSGIILLVFFTLYDYRKLGEYVRFFYIAFILVLVYTCIFGKYVNGAKSWIGIGDFGIQPSEFGKIVFILCLAKYLDSSKEEIPLKRFIYSIIITGIPMLLILAQPDLGTASVYVPIFLIMCFVARLPLSYILFVTGVGLGMIFFTVLPVWNDEIASVHSVAIASLKTLRIRALLMFTGTIILLICIVVRRYLHGKKYFYWLGYLCVIFLLSFSMSFVAGKVLKSYQIKRLMVYLNPASDPQGAGWNIIQSKTAVGAGGIFGKGFLNGTQSHYRFLPQQSTDFIFSILSEEIGFIGGLVVFILYAIILASILKSVKKSATSYGSFIAAGVFAMFYFHFIINVGMVLGIMPITGIPLLFLSYGGSSLWTALTAIGIVMSVSSKK